jgi:hypothetical protein
MAHVRERRRSKHHAKRECLLPLICAPGQSYTTIRHIQTPNSVLKARGHKGVPPSARTHHHAEKQQRRGLGQGCSRCELEGAQGGRLAGRRRRGVHARWRSCVRCCAAALSLHRCGPSVYAVFKSWGEGRRCRSRGPPSSGGAPGPNAAALSLDPSSYRQYLKLRRGQTSSHGWDLKASITGGRALGHVKAAVLAISCARSTARHRCVLAGTCNLAFCLAVAAHPRSMYTALMCGVAALLIFAIWASRGQQVDDRCASRQGGGLGETRALHPRAQLISCLIPGNIYNSGLPLQKSLAALRLMPHAKLALQQRRLSQQSPGPHRPAAPPRPRQQQRLGRGPVLQQDNSQDLPPRVRQRRRLLPRQQRPTSPSPLPGAGGSQRAGRGCGRAVPDRVTSAGSLFAFPLIRVTPSVMYIPQTHLGKRP